MVISRFRIYTTVSRLRAHSVGQIHTILFKGHVSLSPFEKIAFLIFVNFIANSEKLDR